ncbi:Very-long-chain 3-oxoacyl-CoA reductase [Trichinella spiralis]|uniref:Very-long-chain 3-oxoacyl-CoA reductase n=1 Tax=Trichinella spiralis TaxID=6334 RepID=A0ABR3K9R1_TRISP
MKRGLHDAEQSKRKNMNNEEKKKRKHGRFVEEADRGRHEADRGRHEAEQEKTKERRKVEQATSEGTDGR